MPHNWAFSVDVASKGSKASGNTPKINIHTGKIDDVSQLEN